jgi:hypothetical protein
MHRICMPGSMTCTISNIHIHRIGEFPTKDSASPGHHFIDNRCYDSAVHSVAETRMFLTRGPVGVNRFSVRFHLE